MVTITDISRNRSICCILLDSGERFWLRSEDVSSAGFIPGMLLEYNGFLQQIRLYQYPRALNHAVSMLARRPCSKKEIINRLVQLRYTKDVSDLVILKLEKEKLLNDEEFCEQWIHFRCSKGFGSAVIRQELKNKGIPDDMISRYISHADAAETEKNALILARKAWQKTIPKNDIRKSRQKVILALVRRGYDWETARSACNKAESENETNCPD